MKRFLRGLIGGLYILSGIVIALGVLAGIAVANTPRASAHVPVWPFLVWVAALIYAMIAGYFLEGD